MWILIVVFSGLSFVQDEPLLAESTYSIVFHNERRCVAAQEWLTTVSYTHLTLPTIYSV